MSATRAALTMEFPDASSWVLQGSAQLTGAITPGPYSGKRALYLFASRGFGPLAGSEATLSGLAVDLDIPTTLTFKINAGNKPSSLFSPLSATITCGTVGFVDSTIFSGAGWQSWTLGPFTPDAATLDIDFTLPVPPPATVTQGYYLIDAGLIATVSQHYPPENGQRLAHETWHVDEVTGAMMRRGRAWRDWEGRLVDWMDNADDLGNDDQNFPLPIESPTPPDPA